MNNPKKVEDAFYESFMSGYRVSEEWQKELYSYVVLGLPPGGFHTAVYAGDLMMAAAKSHVLNDWQNISSMCKWLMNVAPRQCWGSYENVEAWLKLSPAEHKKICLEKRLLYTEQEVVWNIIKEKS